MNSEVFKKYTFIPKTLYNNWETIIDNEKFLSVLDKRIKSVLNLKNLPPNKKWIMYKKELLKYANINRKKTEDNNFSNISDSLKIKNNNIGVDKSMNTDVIASRNKSLQTTTTQTMDSSTDPITMNEIFPHIKEEVFENNYDLNLNDDDENFDEASEASVQILDYDPEEIEVELHKEAQKALRTKRSSDVIKDLKTVNKDYRTFSDRNSGESVDILVDEVIKKLYNNDHPNPINQTPAKPQSKRSKKLIAVAEQNSDSPIKTPTKATKSIVRKTKKSTLVSDEISDSPTKVVIKRKTSRNLKKQTGSGNLPKKIKYWEEI